MTAWRIGVIGWLAACLGATAVAAGEAGPQQTIADAARKVVKLYGAGGRRGLEGYQTGILVSPDGRILTAASSALDSETVDCVLDDGRRYLARLLGVDPRRELALLDIDAEDLPAFTLEGDAAVAGPGTRVIALSNMFGVAFGDERVTAQRGVVAAVVPLSARRGAAEAPYRGEVYVLDCTTNNPGAAGGGLIDSRGRLLGMLGKELRSTESGIWLNYAIPTAELRHGCETIAGGGGGPAGGSARPFDLRLLGAVLVPELLERTPPFVECVDPGSPAERGGLRADDLVIAVGSVSVATRAALEAAVGRLAAGDPMRLAVVRAGEIVDIDLGPRPQDPPGPHQPEPLRPREVAP